MEARLLISHEWIEGKGDQLVSTDPATDTVVWSGRAASREQVHSAVLSADTAFSLWSETSLDDRIEILRAFAARVLAHKDDLAELISRETGKPLWESATEVQSMYDKVEVSIQAYHERRHPSERKIGQFAGRTRYRPHGVLAVIGPFNFPGHLPTGHIVPALLAGNTVVFKPSELTPAVAQRTVELWREAELPAGVINLVHGARAVGEALVAHPDIDGVLFTGSFAAGRAINRALADYPGKVAALEMGGNNPLVVDDVSDLAAAAQAIVQSAYITAGQRCSCARRLIVTEHIADALVDEIKTLMSRIIIGPYTQKPEPFMGPVITAQAAEEILAAQASLVGAGAATIVPVLRLNHSRAMLSPGLIDVTAIHDRPDSEVFGPLLQLIRVSDFEQAMHEANRTCYGLCAGLLSDDRAKFDPFAQQVRAGVINFNRPLTGASGWLPFGGVGCSGNHRPSGYFAADYCSYAVAQMEAEAISPGTLRGLRAE